MLQIQNVMDSILRSVNLDLKFNYYNTIAFTSDDGLLQFTPDSQNITNIKKEFSRKAIETYLRQDVENEEQYRKKMDTYINSMAFGCVTTYLLGIGDRHLENLMVTKSGVFFHVDFGFIFGKEPNNFKQGLASKIRITLSMIEPMGGIDSKDYLKFEQKCCEAYNELRNQSDYLMNLIFLMINTGMPDLPVEQHQRIMTDLYERFMPGKTTQECEVELRSILRNCINHFGAEQLEKFHDMANLLK